MEYQTYARVILEELSQLWNATFGLRQIREIHGHIRTVKSFNWSQGTRYQRYFSKLHTIRGIKRSVKCYKFENYTVHFVVCSRSDHARCRNPLLNLPHNTSKQPHSSPGLECSSGHTECVSLTIGPNLLNSLWLWKERHWKLDFISLCVLIPPHTELPYVLHWSPWKKATQPCISSPSRLNCLHSQVLHLL